MAGDVDSARHPDFVMALDVIEKFFERECATGATDQATVKADIHHLWRAFCPFAVEHVEIVFEIRIEMLAGVEPLRRGKAHIIRIDLDLMSSCI